ncbi:MAG: hypothetical protein QM742_17345 [Aquabacterium sp.]
MLHRRTNQTIESDRHNFHVFDATEETGEGMDDSDTKTLWGDSVFLGSALLGGVIGNLWASAIGVGAGWFGNLLLQKVPELAQMLSQGGQGSSHALLRAFRRAEAAALCTLVEECLAHILTVQGRQEPWRYRWQMWREGRRRPDVNTLLKLRTAFRSLHKRLANMPTDDLVRMHGAALQDVPGLVRSGMECFACDSVEALARRVVNLHIAVLDDVVRGPGRFALLSRGLTPVAAEGLPTCLIEHMRGRLWDALRTAFREELTCPDGSAARLAWQLDVQSHIGQLLETRFDTLDKRLDLLDQVEKRIHLLHDKVNALPTAMQEEMSREDAFFEAVSPMWRPGFSDAVLLRAEERAVPFGSANRGEPGKNLCVGSGWKRSLVYEGRGRSRRRRQDPTSLEACDQLRSMGWATGFLRGLSLRDESAALDRWWQLAERPRFIIIDYVETRPDELVAILESWRRHACRHPVRIVLIARNVKAWWLDLQHRSKVFRALCDEALEETEFITGELRSDVDLELGYHLALQHYGRILGIDPSRVPPGMPRYLLATAGEPLYVQMAALASLRGDRPRSLEAARRNPATGAKHLAPNADGRRGGALLLARALTSIGRLDIAGWPPQ